MAGSLTEVQRSAAVQTFGSWSPGKYLILYRIVQTAKVVEILRFWHGARILSALDDQAGLPKDGAINIGRFWLR